MLFLVAALSAALLQIAYGSLAGAEANAATSCVIDATQSITFIAQAGIAIDMATRGCEGWDETYQKRECAADVGNIIKSFSWVSAFISSAVNDCGVFAGNLPDQQAKCAADVSSVVGAVGALAMGGAGIAAACDPNGVGPKNTANYENNGILLDYKTATALARPPQEQAPPTGYLTTDQMSRSQRDYSATTAMCVVYSLQSTWFLARAALGIDSATRDCTGNYVQAKCAATASGIVAAFSAATSYIAGAAATCSHGVHTTGAGCAAYVSMVTAGMAAIASSAAAASLDCTGLPITRRLQEVPLTPNSTQSPLSDDENRRWLEMLKKMNISYPATWEKKFTFPDKVV
jgi:hypothetical protein